MKLTPKEIDRLTVFTLAELARRHLARGLKLNHPESVALIADEVFEGARAGLPYAEVVARAGAILNRNDVMEGIAEMIPVVQVDALFPDGTRLVTIHHPIR